MGKRKRATLEDVAVAAGVSKTTVSQILNERPISVSERTRTRVMAAVEELNYTPNALIRALQDRKTRVIGVVVGGSFEPSDWQGQLLIWLTHHCRGRGYDALLYHGISVIGGGSPVRMLTDGRCDGAVVVFARKGSSLEKLAESGLPVVQIGSVATPTGVGSVSFAVREAALAGTKHLLDHGHRRIALLAAPLALWDSAAEQLAGYRQALEEAGLPFDPQPVCELPDWSGKGIPSLCAKLVEAESRPMAFVACNMITATSLLELSIKKGLRAPDDFSIVALDDFAPSDFITAVALPIDRLAGAAIGSLTDIIEGADPELERHSVPGDLVVRASSKPCASGGRLLVGT